MKVLLTLILMTNIVLAQEYIGIYAHLRKIKMRILAAEPTLAEYKDFQQRTSLCGASISDPQNKCLNEVLKSKVSEYLAHPIHAARSVDFVHELLYLRPLSSAYEYQQYELQYYKEASSLTQLTDAIFTTNKSRDEFFTSGQYSFFANMRDGLDKSEVFYYLNFVQEKDKPIKNERNYYVQVD